MGKSSKRRKATWTPNPHIDDGDDVGLSLGSASAAAAAVDWGGASNADTDTSMYSSKKWRPKKSYYHGGASASAGAASHLKSSSSVVGGGGAGGNGYNNKKSLRRKKKTLALRQLLDSFPKRGRGPVMRNGGANGTGADAVSSLMTADSDGSVLDLTDIIAGAGSSYFHEGVGDDDDDDGGGDEVDGESGDSIYESRKLVVRQLVAHQLASNGEPAGPATPSASLVHEALPLPMPLPLPEPSTPTADARSEADSWLEMEERFAEIYEPLPYALAMDTWRSMTKEQMLGKVSSARVKSEMSYLSRAEILQTIESMKRSHQRSQQTGKAPRAHPKTQPPSRKPEQQQQQQQQQAQQQQAQQQRRNQVEASSKRKEIPAAAAVSSAAKNPGSHIYQNSQLLQLQQQHSLANIFQAKVQARSSSATARTAGPASKSTGAAVNGTAGVGGQRGRRLPKTVDPYVTRALVHAAPDPCETSQYVSRAEILQKLNGGQPLTGSDAANAAPVPASTFWKLPGEAAAPTTSKAPMSRSELIAQQFRRRSASMASDVRSVEPASNWRKSSVANNNGGESDGSVSPSSSSRSSSCATGCDQCSSCSCSSSSDSVVTVASRVRRPSLGAAAASAAGVRPTYPVTDSQPKVVDEVQRCNSTRVLAALDADGEDASTGRSTPEPVPLSLVKQRKMEFEKIRVADEQEKRLRDLLRRHGGGGGGGGGGGVGVSTLESTKSASNLTTSWIKSATGYDQIYQPVTVSSVVKTSATKGEAAAGGGNKGGGNKGGGGGGKSAAGRDSKKELQRQRSKIIQHLKLQLKQSLAQGWGASAGDAAELERKQQKLKDLLRDALDAGTQTLSNINLGLIYVPMEDNANGGDGSSAGHVEPEAPQTPLALDEYDVAGDTFGSIDTLIFEPRTTATSTLDSISQAQLDIANHFSYLNDARYDSAAGGVASSAPSAAESATDEDEENDDDDDDEDGGRSGPPKNERGAAPAPAVATTAAATATKTTAASTAVAARRPTSAATPHGRRSSAAAASSPYAASDSHSSTDPGEEDDDDRQHEGDDDDDSSSQSVASFSSVIYQGQKLLEEEEKQQLHLHHLHHHHHHQQQQQQHKQEQRQREKLQQQQSTMSSENGGGSETNYTNIDTDGSWDYMDAVDDGDESVDQEAPLPSLSVGNLRKRPTSRPSAAENRVDDDDGTAAMLRLMSLAQDANTSSSTALLFPPSPPPSSSASSASGTDHVTNLMMMMMLPDDDKTSGRALSNGPSLLPPLHACSRNALDDASQSSKTAPPSSSPASSTTITTTTTATTTTTTTAAADTALSPPSFNQLDASQDALDAAVGATSSTHILKDLLSAFSAKPDDADDPFHDGAGETSTPVVWPAGAPASDSPTADKSVVVGAKSPRKRDTMIRELKGRLLEKFQPSDAPEGTGPAWRFGRLVETLLRHRKAAPAPPKATPPTPARERPQLPRPDSAAAALSPRVRFNVDVATADEADLMVSSPLYAAVDGEGGAIYDPLLPEDDGAFGHYAPLVYPHTPEVVFDPTFDFPPAFDTMNPTLLHPQFLLDGGGGGGGSVGPFPYPPDDHQLMDWPHQTTYPYPQMHPEGLYSISRPLPRRRASEEAAAAAAAAATTGLTSSTEPSRRKRRDGSRRWRRRSDPTSHQCWSDVESQIFGDGAGGEFRSLDAELALLGGGVDVGAAEAAMEAAFLARMPHDRMDPYQHDEWLFWEQVRKRRQAAAVAAASGWPPPTADERRRWEQEKARRMLLWVHHSQALQGCDISQHPFWWQVG